MAQPPRPGGATVLPELGTDTRGRILRGTAIAVGRHGIRSCTVQHILDEAGLSRRTFYKAFSSLEDALDGLFDVSMQYFAGRIEAALEEDLNPLTTMERALDAYLSLQRSGGRLIVELQAEAHRAESPLARRRERLIGMLVELFGEALARGGGPRVDPWLIRAMLAGVEGLVLHLQRERRLSDDDVARVRANFSALLRRSLGMKVELPSSPQPAGLGDTAE